MELWLLESLQQCLSSSDNYDNTDLILASASVPSGGKRRPVYDDLQPHRMGLLTKVHSQLQNVHVAFICVRSQSQLSQRMGNLPRKLPRSGPCSVLAMLSFRMEALLLHAFSGGQRGNFLKIVQLYYGSSAYSAWNSRCSYIPCFVRDKLSTVVRQ